jgi:hypothetical protein
VLERNNRGLGVGANLSSPIKQVFRIDIAGATDISGTSLAAGCDDVKVDKSAMWLNLAANVPAELLGKVPDKWEGLAIGPQLRDGSRVLVAGTDNDYSVTQDGSNEQFDVYFRMSDLDPYAGSIQCPLDSTSNCFRTADNTSVVLPGDGSYALLPGVLVAYKVPAADLPGFVPAVPPFVK